MTTNKNLEENEPVQSLRKSAGKPREDYPEFRFLAHMLNVYCGEDKLQEQLEEQHPWLKELISLNNEEPIETAFTKSRESFNHDSNLFLVTLRRFVQAELKLEFFYSFINDKNHAADSQRLLYSLWMRKEEIPTTTDSEDRSEIEFPHKDVEIPADHQYHLISVSNMIKNRCIIPKSNIKKYDYTYFSGKNDDLLKLFPKEKTEEFKSWLSSISARYQRIRNRDIDTFPFSRRDMESGYVSRRWLEIGRKIHNLAWLLGFIHNDSFNFDSGRDDLIGTFRDAVGRQKTELVQLQRFIQEQNQTIQRQEQVITALRFRYLMEHLPDPKTFSKMKESENWADFWKEAVKRAYEDRSGPAGVGPLGKLMQKSFDTVDKKKDNQGTLWSDNKKITWLQQNTPLSHRVRSLYGVLSEVIHNYQDGEFTINPLTYSPDDVAILKCLTPDKANIVNGEVKWNNERKKYQSNKPLVGPTTPVTATANT